MNAILMIARKECAALLYDRRGLIWLLAFSGVLSVFSLLLISNQELSLLDNAQIVYMMCGTVTAAGAVVAVIMGSDAFAGERERGTLTPLLMAPVNVNDLLLGKAAGLCGAWAVMYLLSLPYLWTVAANGQNLLPAMIYLALFGTPVILGFGFLAMAISARSGSVVVTLLCSVAVLLVASIPLLMDPSFRNSTVGKIFDAVNPLSGALNTYDSVIIDSEPFTMQLSRFALVAVWLSATFIVSRVMARQPEFH